MGLRKDRTGQSLDDKPDEHLQNICAGLRELLERGELRQGYIRGPVEVSRTRYTFDDYGFG